MSSSSYWCHSCHSIVRIPSSPPLSCPSCGFGFVELISSEPAVLLLSGNPPRRDLPGDGDGDGGLRDLSGYGSGRSPSSGRGFLRRLFRSNRSSRHASESRNSLLQVLEAASMMQASRNTASRSEGGDGTGGGDGAGPRSASLGLPWLNDDGASRNTDDAPGILGINSEDRSAVARFNHGEASESGVVRIHDGLSPRPFDAFLQRLVSGILQSGRNGSLPASKAAVAAMPTFKVSKQILCSNACGGLDDAPNECAVCKEAFEIGGEVREMPCKHFYHSDCILPWLELHSSCPLCRREMPVETEERASSSATSEGTAGAAAGGEPTIVFIGVSGAGVLVFSFVMLGAGNRTEPTTTPNLEGEQGTQVSSIAEEEMVEGEPGSERGETMTSEALMEALDHDSGVESDNLLMDQRNPSENSIAVNDNIEQIGEQRDSFGMGSEASQTLAAQNDGDVHSGNFSIKETRLGQEIPTTSAIQDAAGQSSMSGGRAAWSARPLNQLMTDSQEGASSGSRSRSFFSWFFQHAPTRLASTSSATESSAAEGTLSDANSTSERCSDTDKNST
eukprot:c21332_g1_i1 orf=407-2092(-)